ncbi:GntR family transcriptional regulator [Microbacterium sp. NPDC056569]|uniref:GntR family transcriptional regulator n=1 Tax=Microbacterium sp. NPDC056569 TaxID=3345867 RepID=UPI00366BA4BA
MIIRLSGSAPPTDQIRDQIRGLIASGRLAGDDRLPSVRQLARDLGVAPGTVAKAYRVLEAEGLLVTRTGGGTRVSTTATTTRRPVLDAVHKLVDTSIRVGVDLDSTIQILRAVWPTSPPDTEPARDPHSDGTRP